MVKKLFVCATVYQLINAIQLKSTLYKNAPSDLIVLDTFKEYQVIAKKIQDENIFERVIPVAQNFVKFKTVARDIFSQKFRKVIHKNSLKSILFENYNEFIFSSLNTFTIYLGAYYLRKIKSIKITLFEDGASSYSKYYERAFHDVNCGGAIKKLIYKVLHNPILYVSKYYLYNPDILIWDAPNVERIPKIDTSNSKLIFLLNKLFNYENLKDDYREKVIFLEESYYADGISVPDIDIVNQLAKQYGKDQIFVKKHPRNPTNRFDELGYKTNEDTIIPWEVIALNIDLSDKIIATISSTAAISTLLMFPNANVQFYCNDVKSNNFRLNSTIEVIKKIQQFYGTKFQEGKL